MGDLDFMDEHLLRIRNSYDKTVDEYRKGFDPIEKLPRDFRNSPDFRALLRETGPALTGSGAIKYPSVDVLAGTPLRKIALEVKTVNNTKKYFSEEEIIQLKVFCERYGAEPWIGIKLKGSWFFLAVENLKKTEKNYLIDIDLARKKGLIFDELVGDFEHE